MAKSDPPPGTAVVLSLQFVGDKDEYEELYVATRITASTIHAHMEGGALTVPHFEDGDLVESVINLNNLCMATFKSVEDFE